jgi:hypothetical protein
MSLDGVDAGGMSRSSVADRGLSISIWLMFACSFVVFIEPAPTDILFAVVLMFFLRIKLFATIYILPLLLLLLLYNFGGMLSYLQAPSEPNAMAFIFTSAYMALTGIIFALYVAANPVKHINLIGYAWVIGAVLAAIWGFIDYFQLPSPFTLQKLQGRATGLFKDPNVYSTYLIFPLIFMAQSLIMKTARRPILIGITFVICLLGLFLSFSRGAWMNFVTAMFLMLLLTYLLSADRNLRTRVILYTVGGFIIAALLFLVMMNIPPIQKMFFERFVLIQPYDGGETGRFGNQMRSIPDLIRLPLGYGPFVFQTIYGEAPHNTFLNAFACYGWMGGISYFVLIISTIIVALRTIFSKTAWQALSIAIFSVMFSTITQGIQIDTEHWRHFYWLLGMLWGVYAASASLSRGAQQTDFEMERAHFVENGVMR